MKILYLYLNFSLLVASIFFISTDFANPSNPTFYSALIGSYLLMELSIFFKYRQFKFSLSAIDSLFVTIIIVLGIESFWNNLHADLLLSLLSLSIFYNFSKRMDLNILWVFLGLTLLGIAQSIYGIGQYFHLWPNIAAPSFRISGSFDNPAGFAATLVACFPFALRCIQEYKWHLKLSGIISSLVIATGVMLAQSRTGIVTLTVITLVWLFVLFSDNWKQRYKQKTMISLVTIITMLLIGSLYFWKKNSADGRLLIWQCSARMIADRPLFGHGVGGFQREYMLYQATYFRQYPNSKYMQLADIVKHPFNEYLLLWVEQGILGILVCVVIIWLVVHTYHRNSDKDENLAFILCLLAIAIFACFSYPLNYPFIKLILVLSIAFIMRKEPELIHIPISGGRILKPIVLLVLFGIITLTCKMFYNEYYWNTIACRSLAGETRKVLPEYAQLYPWMRSEALFLYNYAAELNYIGEWKKSNQLMTECSRYYNDYDVQLILADNYQQLKHFNKAEQHLKLAHEMIPNRFIPLYRLVHLYQLQGRNYDARKLAKQIIDMPIKIPSNDIFEIKQEMIKFL